MESLAFRIPDLLAGAGATARQVDGWIEEVQNYVVKPRPKPKFKAVLSAAALFGRGDVRSSVVTRIGPEDDGGRRLELHVTHLLGGRKLTESLT